MKIRYEIKFAEPLVIDGTWPLELPDGGRLTIVKEGSKATAFEVHYSGKPSDHFTVKDGVQSLDDKRWNRMRWFFARLKSYIQCLTDIDFDPTEVFVHYDGETQEEKEQIRINKLVLVKRHIGNGDPLLDHDMLAAAAYGSCHTEKQAPYFVGELKSLSRRSAREGRYVDSFRYSFLIIDTLYGNGQFKSRQLSDALKSENRFMDMLEAARNEIRWIILEPKDDTETIIFSADSTENLVDHIVEKRGYYFHGQKEMVRDADWRADEARALCHLLHLTTNKVCYELTQDLYNEEAWRKYQQRAKEAGMVTDAEMRCRFWCPREMREVVADNCEQLIGDESSARTRVKWALNTLERVKYDEKYLELRELVCSSRELNKVLYRIDVVNTGCCGSNGSSKTGDVDIEDNLKCVVKFEFAEEKEKAPYSFCSTDPSDSLMWKSVAVKWIIEEALKASLRFGHVGLRRICQGRRETRPKGGAKYCHHGRGVRWSEEVGIRLGAAGAGNAGRA